MFEILDNLVSAGDQCLRMHAFTAGNLLPDSGMDLLMMGSVAEKVTDWIKIY